MSMCRLVPAVLCACILAVGCGRKAEEKAMEKAIEKQTGGKASVNIDKNSFSVKTKDGEFTMTSGGDAKIPDDFPSDVFVYKGSTVFSTLKVPDGQQVQLTSKDAVSKVADAYKKEMTAKGWTEESTVTMGEQVVLSYQKDDLRTAVMVMGEKDLSRIILTVTKDKSAAKSKKTAKQDD